MTFGVIKRYPAGPITPHGAYYTLNERKPLVALRAYDDSIVFNLMGGLAIPDRTLPERVELTDLKGLVSPWTVIDQKGASQDGVTFVDSLYDPIEVELSVRCVGRDPAHLRQVVRDLVSSIDNKQESELSWFTHYLGRWWAPVRWFKTPDTPLAGLATNRQDLVLILRADTGFWQSYPHVDQFRFIYDEDVETFDFITAEGDPITGWTLVYSGAGSGVLHTDGAEAVSTLISNRTVVARRTDFTASTDNMVVEIQLGTNIQPFWPTNTYIDVWGRMGNAGTAGSDGVRWRIGDQTIKLSSFSGGVETVMRELLYLFPIFRPGEKCSFVFGQVGDPRMFTMLRNNAPFISVKESGTTSIIDSSHRKAGFGMSATSGIVRPFAIRNWKVGTNNTIAQEGFVERVNVGDQPMWDRFTCFGPGTFYFGNGPSSTDMVKFGPLLPNQVMQINTHPGKQGVVDMTSIPSSPQDTVLFNQAISAFFAFFSQANAAAAIQATQSIFGITAPQGNPYSLLSGRFSRPIPARSPGNPVQSHYVKVKIEGGNSNSQIIVAGTPLRRLPY